MILSFRVMMLKEIRFSFYSVSRCVSEKPVVIHFELVYYWLGALGAISGPSMKSTTLYEDPYKC